MTPSLTYRRLRAPQHDGGLLVEPAWPSCIGLLETNASRLTGCDFELHGSSFQSLRSQARADFLRLAVEYTSQYSDCEIPAASRPVVIAGHQPQLFHPGVWAKNFAIDRLAIETRGVAVQLIIDNDLCRDHALRVPTGNVTRPHVVSEPYDRFDNPVPFEKRQVRDLDVFSSFSRRVADRVAPLVADPVVRALWPHATAAARAAQPLGQAVARARHLLERSWGLRTLELPLSHVCETSAFRLFVVHLLLRGDEVRASHNRWLAEYRRTHRLRSAAQPIPDLRQSDGWTEAPFWMWTQSDPRRRPLWLRRSRDRLRLSDLGAESWCLEQPERDVELVTQQILELSRGGLSIRPRALSNTMFARLFLGDLFVHGIGGAKYDQITDLWMADLFPLDPPGYATLSLTLHLPIQHRSAYPSEEAEARQILREMHFHPERFLSPTELNADQVSPWVEAKRTWIRQELPRGQRLARHHRITEANAMLGGFLQEKREKIEKKIGRLHSQIAACSVLESREWSLCVYPADFLREKLLDLGRSSL